MTAGTTTATPVVTDLVHDVETWLINYEQTQPSAGIRWRPNRGRNVTVYNLEALAVAVSKIPSEGNWGVVEWVDGPDLWGQTMRCPGGWVVEVHDGTNTDFAQRVYHRAVGPYDTKPPTALHPHEVWTSLGAADILWSWLHGGLPDGCSRTLDYLTDADRKRYGVS